MTDLTCSVADCDRRRSTKLHCSAHASRLYKTGSLGDTPIRGKRSGCSVKGCKRKHFGRGYCQMHRYRLVENGDALVTRGKPRRIGAENPSWLGDGVKYSAVHRRLRSYLGPARHHACTFCPSDAAHWAFDHRSPEFEIVDDSGLVYSTSLGDYIPLCLPCHRAFDKHYRNSADASLEFNALGR